jgi:hypothetical protein
VDFDVSEEAICMLKLIQCVLAWMAGVCDISMLQSINVGTKVMVAATLSSLPGSSTSFLMAVGGLDQQVHLYVGGLTGQVLFQL